MGGLVVPQYTALFLVMNSTGEIVDYKLKNTTKMSTVANLKRKLKERLSSLLTMVIVDNCFTIREKKKKKKKPGRHFWMAVKC